jgi:NADP-dependent 3-hydroxy acid dehydrogenase YdfG
MPANLTGKVVVVTGASGGIGEACAVAFAAHGCKLVLIARRAERLQLLANSLATNYKVLSRLSVYPNAAVQVPGRCAHSLNCTHNKTALLPNACVARITVHKAFQII